MHPSISILDDRSIRGGRLWSYVFLAHGFAAAFWWWLMPAGFPWSHARFWMNQVLPLAVMTTAVIGCYGLWTKKLTLAKSVIFAILGFWSALVPISWLTFPISARRFGVPAGMILGAVWFAYFLRSPRCARKWSTSAGLIPALFIGGILPFAQRAPDPSVVPRNQPMPFIAEPATRSKDVQTPRLSPTVRVNGATGSIAVTMAPLSIEISPLLSFVSRSPDRCWTIFAAENHRIMPKRILSAQHHQQGHAEFGFTGDANHVLQVWAEDAEGSRTDCTIESFTQLEEPVFSHLNSFCELLISGHRRLSISFSPCPDVRVEVEPSDYPVGRPARFAYLDADKILHIVEATSGEKGPFRSLGSGPLVGDDELTISLYDQANVIGTIAFSDWGNQASTKLSPTAGWGVPMNSIEFCRTDEALDSTVAIWFTLAGTSVGRGWDSVGHGVGTYRNRIRIEGRNR